MPKNKGNRRAIQAPVRPAPVVRLAPVVRHPGFPVYQTTGGYSERSTDLSWDELNWTKGPYAKYASNIIELLAEPETYTNNLIRYGGGTLEDHNYEDHSNWGNKITGKADGTFTRPDEIRGSEDQIRRYKGLLTDINVTLWGGVKNNIEDKSVYSGKAGTFQSGEQRIHY